MRNVCPKVAKTLKRSDRPDDHGRDHDHPGQVERCVRGEPGGGGGRAVLATGVLYSLYCTVWSAIDLT